MVGHNRGYAGIPSYLASTDPLSIGKETVVYKFPFFNPLFSEPYIAKWPFSERILVTTFDLYKDDTFVQNLSRTGTTLKEYLTDEIGLNPNIKIFADTGIFEFEAKKARLDIASGFDMPVQLTNTEIFDGYELIDPDFLVAPDEIVLLSDSAEQRSSKIEQVKHNLIATLDRFPRTKVFATLQGIYDDEIRDLSRFIVDQGITKIARGGIIPLRKVDRYQYFLTLKQSEIIAREEGISYLHAFGMASTWSLGEYFVENSYDSLDTSAIYWISARRKYILSGGQQIPVRKAYFDRCGCRGCKIMKRSKRWADTSGRFAGALYYHNCQIFTDIVTNIHIDPKFAQKFRPRIPSEPAEKEDKTSSEREESIDKSFNPETFSFHTASSLQDFRAKNGSRNPIHEARIKRIDTAASVSKILILSNCSKRKKYRTPPDAVFLHPSQLESRQYIFDKYQDQTLPAWKMYNGSQMSIIVEAVAKLRRLYRNNPNIVIDHNIISAGYGIITEDTPIISYDSTFSKKPSTEIKSMSDILSISDDLKQLLNKQYDEILVLVSKTYFQVIQNELLSFSGKNTQIITFDLEETENHENITNFSIEEFRKLHKLNRLQRVIGRIWNARGNILYNYAIHLQQSSQHLSFVEFWHELYDCQCDT